jgi:hypothetical protein
MAAPVTREGLRAVLQRKVDALLLQSPQGPSVSSRYTEDRAVLQRSDAISFESRHHPQNQVSHGVWLRGPKPRRCG